MTTIHFIPADDVRKALYGFKHLSTNDEVREWMKKCERQLGL